MKRKKIALLAGNSIEAEYVTMKLRQKEIITYFTSLESYKNNIPRVCKSRDALLLYIDSAKKLYRSNFDGFIIYGTFFYRDDSLNIMSTLDFILGGN